MTTRTKNIIGWVLSGIAAALLIASATDKIISSEHAVQMANSFGISAVTYRLLGIIELTAALLFLYTRTGMLGLLLLSSYLGGAIATHLQHGQDILFPMTIEALTWMAAAIRFPELSSKILKNEIG
jgi:hypothetical protein